LLSALHVVVQVAFEVARMEVQKPLHLVHNVTWTFIC